MPSKRRSMQNSSCLIFAIITASVSSLSTCQMVTFFRGGGWHHDGTASFYLALAESKRFRLGHIRNGKISYRLYPKRKDCVSLNVAIKNLAAVHLLNVFSEVSQNDWNLQFIENIFCKKYFHANWTEMFYKLQITFSLKIPLNIFPDIEEGFICKWSLI